MLKHYLQIGFRNFLKHKTSSLINALGLSIAIACCLFVFLFLRFFLTTDDFHEHGENIYAINRDLKLDGYNAIYAGVPDPLGSSLLEESTHVINMSRLQYGKAYVKFEEKVFDERIQFADPSFLDMFSFPLKWGSPKDLNQPNAVILSEKTSEKYFGDSNPVGYSISVKFFIKGQEKVESFVVKGVASEFPRNASFSFSMLMNYDKQFALGLHKPKDWSTANSATFIQLANPNQINLVKNQSKKYVSRYNQAQENSEANSLSFEPLKTCSLHSDNINNSIFNGTATAAFVTLSILAVLMLTMACINYMNIAMASASYRLKEIGVRKVMGSNRKQLVIQFFTENSIVCFIALLLGILWAEAFFLPGLNAMANKEMFFIEYSNNPNLYMFFGGVLVLTIIGGAGYPSFYISKFQPVSILKDKVRFGGKNLFRKALLGFQYFFAFVTIACAVILMQNNTYQTTIDWGYDEEQIITVKVNGKSNFEKLKNKIEDNPSITKISGANNHVGQSIWERTIEINKKKYVVDELNVGEQYLETMGIKVVKGRSFNDYRTSDQNQSVIVNNLFVKKMGWDNPLDKTFQIDKKNYHVIGEVKNFHYRDFGKKIGPLMIRTTKSDNFKYLCARVNNESLIEAGATIEAAWKKLFPNDPYNYFYQDTVFDRFYQGYSEVTTIITTAGMIAIFLAVIGLFGLSSLSIKSKFKEISIRKVLGGDWSHLAYILNKEFIVLLAISSLIAAPVSYFAVELLLSTLLLYTMPMTILPFVFTGFLLLMLSLIAVGGHVYRAVYSNPSESLRVE